MVNQFSVSVSGNFAVAPNPIKVSVNDQIVWVNSGSAPITLSSNDGGQTFTTGPIQPGQQSLPITFLAPNPALGYGSSPPGVKGTVIVGGYAPKT